MKPSTRTAILKSIIRDRASLFPAFIAGVTFLLLQGLNHLGFKLTLTQEAGFSAFVGTLLAAILNGWALNVTSEGVEAMQAKQKEIHPSIEVDGLAGPQTVRMNALTVDEVKAQEGIDHRGRR